MLDVLHHQPLLLLFVVTAAGWLLGRIEVGGFSLGPAAVLFAGLTASALDPRLVVPEELGLFGLCLFVYAVGLASGPAFVEALRGRGLRASALTVLVISFSALVSVVGARVLGLPSSVGVGLFAGGLTNTPALAAAVDVLRASGGDASSPVIGYSVAYPLGVLLPLLVLWRRSRSEPAQAAKELTLVSRTIRLTTQAGRADELRERLKGRIGFGRYRRGDVEAVVDDATPLEPGDLVTVVGRAEAVAESLAVLGQRVDDDLADDRALLDFRRIFVSRPDVIGKPLSVLALPERFGAIVTRVRRGDVDLLADRDTTLELGDRVRVLAPRARFDELSRFFGDSYRALAEIDVLSFGLGIALGLALGLVPIPTPVGPLKLGLAGGPLLVGLVLGRLGRTGPLVWVLPFPASVTLRQLGIVLFLAVVGTRSGASLGKTMTEGNPLPLVLLGAMVTLASAGPALLLARRWLKLSTSEAFGAVAGIHTQPAVLAWASARTSSDAPAKGYATVFPIATVVKILLAQVLVRFF